MENKEAFHELTYYTLAHPNPAFIHQHVVDAYTAQAASEQTKPIAITFALFGLYLYLEKGFTGKQVQQAHMRLANANKTWPKFDLPEKRGDITVIDVLKEKPGEERDTMISKWCERVWYAYWQNHKAVETLVQTYLLDK